jgi:putative hydrolase of the HAD superfamily
MRKFRKNAPNDYDTLSKQLITGAVCMLRAILFDFGDTLVDFEPMATRAVFLKGAASSYAFLKERGYTLPPFDLYCKRQFSDVRWAYLVAKLRRREFNGVNLLRSFCRSIGVDLNDADLLELAWLWYEPLTLHASVENDLLATLADLRDRGLKLGLISNTFVGGAIHDRHLEQHGLLDLFPVRVYSSEVGYRKPDARIFQIALDQLDVTAREAMFVGDLVKTDMVGARGMGMTTVLKQPWGTSRSHRRADFVIQQLSELTGIVRRLQPTREYAAVEQEMTEAALGV